MYKVYLILTCIILKLLQYIRKYYKNDVKQIITFNPNKLQYPKCEVYEFQLWEE